ncbi:hypothetical protein BJ742DRAFT_840438 [Cladochytrium replicatum]|nr:hypothetical protein BJ742DRAFT_840438 [Cladochytrium replicatum]
MTSQQDKDRIEREIFGDSDDDDLDELPVEDSDDDDDDRANDAGSRAAARADARDEDFRSATAPKKKRAKEDGAQKLPSFKKNRSSGDGDGSGKRGRKRKENEDPEDRQPVEEDETAVKRKRMSDYIDSITRSTSNRTRRKAADEDDTTYDDMAVTLVEMMKAAASKDAAQRRPEMLAAGEKLLPATAKLKLLPQVEAELSKPNLWNALLENGIALAIQMWLEPLDDKSLPSLDIQRSMMNACDKLPFSVHQLRECKLGRVVKFYTAHPRVVPEIKREASALISKWTRNIIKRSDNYRDRQYERREVQGSNGLFQRRQAAGLNDDEGESSQSRRARVPLPLAAGFSIVPASTVVLNEKAGRKVTATSRLKKLSKAR